MKRILCVFLTLLMLLSLTACKRSEQPLSRTMAGLDTVCAVSLYDNKNEAVLDAVFAQIAVYEQLWSRTEEESDIFKLNAAGGKEMIPDPRTYNLLKTAQDYTIKTDGAFDIATGALTDLWRAAQERDSLPTEAELTAARFTVGGHRYRFGDDTVAVQDGTLLDLGGIAKGAIADAVAKQLKESGCTSAVIDLGGNIVAVGKKPDGELFHIGIADPNSPDQLVGTIAVSDRAVVTSGSYERNYEIGGKRYSHILDPKTGKPVDNDLASVTVLAPTALQADVLSTAFFVMGFERANVFLKNFENVDAVFVKTNGKVIATDGVVRVDTP